MSNGTITMTSAEYDALAGKITTLEAENARLRAGQEDDEYPPCDYCGVVTDYHPWHGSGFINGRESPHIHSCNECRHLLPSTPQPSAGQEPVAWTWYEYGSEFNGYEGRPRISFTKPKGGATPLYTTPQPSAVPAAAASITEEIDWLIRQWDAKVSWSGERMAELLEAAGKAAAMLASAPSAPATVHSVNQQLLEALEGMVEYFPEGSSDGECFSVDAARAAIAAARQEGKV